MAIDLLLEYERSLTEHELAQVMAESPDQVHLAPNHRGVTAYWFKLTVTLGGNSRDAGSFFVRADSLAAAQEHAVVIGEGFRAQVEQELRESDQRL